MLIESICRRLAVCIAACAAILVISTPVSAAGRDLPPGIAPSLRDTGRPLVSVVAADIDADGDIDVIASDGSLDLLVWVNDGTGQYTRKRPGPVHEGRTDAPGPGVEGRAPFSQAFTSSDSPSFDANVRQTFDDPLSCGAPIHLASDPHIQRSRAALAVRGPPLPSSAN